MKKALFDPPDSFSMAPLVALLPVLGNVTALPALASSLFARYEKVQAFQSELGSDTDRNLLRRITAEEAMLKQVLDWLALHPEEQGEAE